MTDCTGAPHPGKHILWLSVTRHVTVRGTDKILVIERW